MHESPRFALVLILTLLMQPTSGWPQAGNAARQGGSAASGGGGNCGEVKCDCATHKMTIGGQQHTINCGKNNTTRNGRGKVGGRHSGPVVKDGVNIESPGMGQEGGGKVFHLPFGGGEPNGSDSTKGCIAVNKQVLDQLKSCQGAPLEITGVGGGGAGNSPASPAAVRGPASTGRPRAGR